jgi:SAM-dependent methyltransferase
VDEGPGGWGAPLHARALERAGVRRGTRLLDLGCGSGVFARAAADRGALVTGLDADPGAVAAAAALVPDGSFAVGDAHDPPPGPFDVVAAVQLLAHVTNPVAVLRGAGRVGAGVVVTVWGRESECDVRAFGEALARWLPPRGAAAGPPPVTEPSRLRRLVELAGLRIAQVDEVSCHFDYPDEDALLGPLLASGLGRHALNRAGPAAVRAAVHDRLAAHRAPTGGYRLQNLFRILLAHPTPRREQGGERVQ